MEKTKKLFGYIVIAMVALSLFFAGMTMQSIRSFALDEGWRDSIEYKPAPTVINGGEEYTYTDTATGETQVVKIETEITLTPISEVANGKNESEMTAAEKQAEEAYLDTLTQEEVKEYQETKTEMRKAQDEVKELVDSLKVGSTAAQDKKAEETFGKEVLEEMDKVAKKISEEKGAARAYDRDVMEITDVFKADLGTRVAKLLEQTKKPVKITFAVDADLVLFKSTSTEKWKSLKIVTEEASNAPLNSAEENVSDTQKTTTVEMDETEGVLVFQKVRSDADTIMEEKAELEKEKEKDNKPATKDEKCCKDCGKNCPFCKFLCKDGHCYCWTFYLVIALAVILLILVIALAVVKAKAKKVPDAQLPEEEEETVARKPQQPRNDEEDQQNQQNQQNQQDQQGNQPRQ